MRKRLILIWFLGMAVTGCAQVASGSFQYQYRMVRMDSTWDSKVDPMLQQYVEIKHQQLEEMINIVIGHSERTLNSFVPESPLSNFLTTLLLERGPQYVDDPMFAQCDMSLLNFGGIRSQIPAGDVRVADIYDVSPFENTLVFLQIKGSELRKALMRFTDKKNEPMAGVVMTYRNGKPVKILVGKEPLDDNRLYTMVTLDFIAKGGDGIISGVQFENAVYVNMIFRDFLIEEIKEMTSAGKSIDGRLEGRVVIERQP
ncbi:MAG: 5'-nucleotidase C-terminal domain-containing protein [Bacteroidales bacterium]|nr:5'-nucleotidase C-terminal domain-containing protein [Bacteroidales bacterium]